MQVRREEMHQDLLPTFYKRTTSRQQKCDLDYLCRCYEKQHCHREKERDLHVCTSRGSTLWIKAYPSREAEADIQAEYQSWTPTCLQSINQSINGISHTVSGLLLRDNFFPSPAAIDRLVHRMDFAHRMFASVAVVCDRPVFVELGESVIGLLGYKVAIES